MATALEAAMQTADDASPTTIVSTPVVADVPPEPSTHPERPARARPRTTAAPRSRRQGRGPSAPSGVLIALLALIGIVGGAIAVAAVAGGSRTLDSGSPASEAAVETPTRTPKPTPTPSPTPSPTPKPTPSATPTPSPTPVAEGATADLCEIFFDIPCGLGAGRYAPSRFRPAFDIELGDGWSNAAHREDIVVLTRPEGTLTFAGGLRQVFPRGKPGEPSTHARDLMESFIATDGVGATKPKGIRIDRRRAYSSDLQPVGRTRVPLFSTDGSTFNLEPDRTTRIVVVDLPGDDTIVFAIEPSDGYELRDILETADPVAGSINWR
jgi:hypothetical protein